MGARLLGALRTARHAQSPSELAGARRGESEEVTTDETGKENRNRRIDIERRSAGLASQTGHVTPRARPRQRLCRLWTAPAYLAGTSISLPRSFLCSGDSLLSSVSSSSDIAACGSRLI